MVALNARVEGDFETSVRWPRLFFEGYLGYSWVFPQSDDQANVGIGWAGDDRPDDYFAALRDTAVRNGFPVPKSDEVSVDTIPRGPGLSPDRVQFPEDGVYLVGDAAGTANRYQGEGICQAIRSARLFCECLSAGLQERYAEKLFSRMRPEYVLAEVIRGVWEEHQSLPLLTDVVRALDGATITDITRSPSRVAARLFRRPSTVAKLFANRSMLRRTARCLSRNWDFPH